MTSSVEQAGAPLPGVTPQPSPLAAAVASGQLWMEAGVAERAAARCDQAVKDIDSLLTAARWLIQRREFGRNKDGGDAAKRFSDAGQDYIDTMKNVGQVFKNMASTYRVAGRTATEMDLASEQVLQEIDAANAQMFQGWSE